MFKTRLVLMIALVAFVAAPVQATGPYVGTQIDSMDNIFARPWYDARDPGEGTGWLMQNNVTMSEGSGSMEIDYGVTNDSLGVPDPLSGYDYLGAFVGIGAKGGSFDAAGNYVGKFDREIVGVMGPGELPIPLVDSGPGTHVFVLDVFKTVANSPEHVRELQIYDSGGARNTYSVQSEAGASTVGAGWKTYLVNLACPLENSANLADIQEIRLFVSAWSAFVSGTPPGPGNCDIPFPSWPTDYTVVRPTGTPVLIDDLRLIPEPATMTMLALGGLALLRRRKKA